VRRREFLTWSGRGLLASGLAPLRGYADPGRQASSGQQGSSTYLARLVAGLEAKIPDWIQKAAVPGLGIALIQNATLAWRRGFGVKDASSSVPVDDATMFEAASMSKPVFAYVVMKLCESGIMDLDTPLTKYVPDRFIAGDSRLDAITARHVLSHTGGFQNWRSDKTPLAIHFTPGSKYMYSGEGYNYLQTVVTKLLAQPFETVMTKRLFEPFGMTSSRYVWTDEATRRMARPHDGDGKPIDPSKSTEISVARYGSAGALLSTPADYARFMIEVIDPKPADSYRLKAESVREMLRPHVKLEGGEFPASWALGWQIFQSANRDFIHHGGDNKGFHCVATASVAGRSGFVAMTNGEKGPSVLRNLLTLDLMQEFLAGG
jgi:CubicO group peptidase (beta-lactamase class C family)